MNSNNNSNSSTNILSSNSSIVMFEPDIIEEWIDPFDSTALKILTFLTYIINVWASIVMFAFVSFETGGDAGHYRTAINQLLSCGYGGVRLLIF